MKFYIAARYGRKAEAKALALKLQELGHGITSTWIDQAEDEMLYDQGPDAAARFAQKDLNEISSADGLIALSETEDSVYGRGGRHVELGYALAAGCRIIVIGPRENLFHYLLRVDLYDTEEIFFQALSGY